MREDCSGCRFWLVLGDRDGAHARATGYDDADGYTGACRRWPPRAPLPATGVSISATDTANTSSWPITWDEDWCGEFSAAVGER